MEQEFSEFGESDKSLKHEKGSIEKVIPHVCLAGAVVASRSLTQEATSLNLNKVKGMLKPFFALESLYNIYFITFQIN